MTFHPFTPHRKQIRFPGYNYKTPGYYFVTFCTEKRLYLFGEIINGKLLHNEAGKLVHRVFKNLRHFYLGVDIDTFVVMPNHIHAIIVLDQKRQYSLSAIIKNIKTYTTTCYTKGVYQKNWNPFYKRLWQRGYYEIIIRDATSLSRIRKYIIQNPLYWKVSKK